MSKVTISLNGRAFTIGCEEGQQAYLRELAGHLDTHVRDLAEKVGQIGDVRLLLMAALIVTDEMREARGKVDELEDTVLDLKGKVSQADARRRSDRARAAESLISAAEKLEAMIGIEAATGAMTASSEPSDGESA